MQERESAQSDQGDAAGFGPPSTRLPSPMVALEFLTVLRLRRPRVIAAAAVARAQLWYPLVGLLLGGLAAGIDRLLTGRMPAAPEAALLVLLLEGLTGLLHLDGLADAADGLLGLHSRERRLEIMRDSRTGSFGVAAIALILLLAFAAVSALSGPARSAVLLVSPVTGRAAMVTVMAAFPYARTGGLADGFHLHARSWVGATALAMACVIALLALGVAGIGLLAGGIAAALLVGVFARVRVGGVTGDVVGASCEVAQVVCLTLAAALQAHSWFRPWF